jgi:hypothetical protein
VVGGVVVGGGGGGVVSSGGSAWVVDGGGGGFGAGLVVPGPSLGASAGLDDCEGASVVVGGGLCIGSAAGGSCGGGT